MAESDELLSIVSGLRTALERAARRGALGAPARPSPRRERPPAPGVRPSAPPPIVVAGDPAAEQADLFSTPARRLPSGADGLRVVREDLGECTRCKLSGGRTHIVFGVGNPRADLVFVGEGPGRDEDEQGEPFVGRAGQLLTRMIAAMGLRREDVYICNVVKCRPPQNRNPEPDEVAACEPFLKMQLHAIGPRLIVALGNFAVQTLLRTRTGITALRGRFHVYQGIPLMPTFHPAFLLRSPHMKKQAWEDLRIVMAEMDRLGLRREQR
jgi:uracil-DNA glycosylase